MVARQPEGRPALRLVSNAAAAASTTTAKPAASGSHNGAERDIDWSILMARAQDGDGAAYRRLLEQITPYVRSLAARRHNDQGDVEDAVQDVLLTIHALRATYDPVRPFGPWLVTIASRRLIDRLRRQGRQRSRETALTEEHETLAMPPTDMEKPERQRALAIALESLPPGQRQAIKMLKLKEMSLIEAAEKTGLSISALKVATHRALKALRKLMSPRSGP